MSFADGLWLALDRATQIALVAVLIAGCVHRRQRIARPMLAMLLLIWLTPTLLIGYAYSTGPFSVARHARLNELLYSTLLLLKLLPIAVAVLRLAPAPPLSREADFLRHMAPAGSALATRRVRHAVTSIFYGRGRNLILTGAVIFLLAFQDFELAALMNVASGRAHSAYTWTIALHEARQLSAPTADILARAAWAILVQVIILGAAGLLLWRTRQGQATTARQPSRPSRTSHAAGAVSSAAAGAISWCAVTLAFIAICILPGSVIARGAATGMGELLAAFRFGDELMSSLYFAVGATALVLVCTHLAPRDGKHPSRGARWVHSRWVHSRWVHSRWVQSRWALYGLLCLPGLMGGLVLGMLLMGAFQLPMLRGLYDTPVPLVLGLTLLALPVALLLNGFFRTNQPGEAVHLAAMLRQSGDGHQQRAGRSLLWALRGRSWFLLGAFLFFFCYLELVVSVTLAPIAMTPAIVELYNQMHYGQRALLSALMAVTMLAPVMLASIAWGVFHLARR